MRKWVGIVAIAGGVLVVGACSSSSDGSSFPEVDASSGIDSGLPSCPSSVVLGAGNTETNEYAGGSCATDATPSPCNYSPGAGPGCNQSFDEAAQFTCTCDGATWTCRITGGGLGGNACDAATMDATSDDASSDAAAVDASDD